MNQSYIRKILDTYYQEPPPYPRELPEELKPWHCYPQGAGHSILCVRFETVSDEHGCVGYNAHPIIPDADIEMALIPVPVKTVLRHGYEMIAAGNLGTVAMVRGLTYDPAIGLVTPQEDDEF